MDENELIKKLLEIHEKRKQSEPLPQNAKFYRFKEPGEKFIGRITGKVKDRFDRDRFVAVELHTNEEYVLPGHKALLGQLEMQNAEPGDYVVIEYLGQSESGYHRYDSTVVSKDEFKELQALEEKKDEIEELLGNDLDEDLNFQELLEDNNSEENQEEVVEKNNSNDDKTEAGVEEAKKCIESLFAFHSKLPLSEIDYYLNQVKKLNVNTKEILESLGYTIVDNEVIRKEE